MPATAEDLTPATAAGKPSQASAPAATVAEFLQHRARQSPQAVATWHRGPDGAWLSTCWSDYYALIVRVAAALRRRGLNKGDRLALLLPTCREWDLLEKAALTLGAVVVGIEPHASVQHKRLVLDRCRPGALVVDQPSELDAIGAERARACRLTVTLHGDGGGDGMVTPAAPITWQALESGAAPEPGANMHTPSEPAGVSAGDPATLIFTSGTTGEPRGVLYTHAQCMAACYALLDIFADFGVHDRVVCWLPMANLFQRMVNLCAAGTATPVYFVTDPRQVMAELQSIEPSLFVGVPRFYEKLYDGMRARIDGMSVPRRWLARAALGIAARHGRARRARRSVPRWLRLAYAAADTLVLLRLRAAMGGRIRCMITGSAPCPLPILEFFDAVGLPLLEAYGLSEDIVPVAINRPDDYRLGSVGRVLAPNQVKIAADGELLVRGPGVFGGYFQSADPRRGFDADGFFATGDYGRFDEDGYLHLSGRKSELIKTSTGRRLAPARIENALRRSPLIDQAVVLGSGRKALVAVLTLDRERLDDEAVPGLSDDRLRARIAREVAQAQSALAAYERVGGCLLSERAFTVQDGDLTPSLKLRRAAIENRYAGELERLYRELERAGRAAASRPTEPIVRRAR